MKVVITLLNLLIAALFFSVVYSAANVNVSFDVGAVRSGGFMLQGDHIVTSFPVRINNGGLYPISNVRILFTIANGSKLVYNHTFLISEIPALKTYEKTFILSMNLTKLYEELGAYYIFHHGTFKIHIYITGHYWYMANFVVRYTKNISWNPLIYSFIIYKDETSIKGNELLLPYFISKIPVPLNASISIKVSDSKGSLAEGTQPVIFNRKTTLHLHMLRSPTYLLTHNDSFHIHYTLYIDSYPVSGAISMQWKPILKNLQLADELINNTPYVVLKLGTSHGTYHLIINTTIVAFSSVSNKTENVTITQKSTTIPIAPLSPSMKGVKVTIYVKELKAGITLEYGKVVP